MREMPLCTHGPATPLPNFGITGVGIAGANFGITGVPRS